jgi:2-polyprenyl-6-hydroxyphenyl methylase/3-demethylubiquinone-9 3-methyltransferase
MSENKAIPKIIHAYGNWIIRLYVRIRFHILRQRFLDEIDQYLPENGKVLDIGCGFGLFSMYFALKRPSCSFEGIDLNQKRIDEANRTASKIGLRNVKYRMGSAVNLSFEDRYQAIYMLDIIHHIPAETVEPLLKNIYGALSEEGVLIIKDINTKPTYQRWFTWWLDKAMDPKTPVHYWPSEDLKQLLHRLGFVVFKHHMVDYLPYPHVLYVCHKKQ